jgi:hypothetical protein
MNTDKNQKIILFPIGVHPLPSVFIILILGMHLYRRPIPYSQAMEER